MTTGQADRTAAVPAAMPRTAAPSPAQATDKAVADLAVALARHGLKLPSLRSDTVEIRGEYLVDLGRAPVRIVTALTDARLRPSRSNGPDSAPAP